MEKKLNCVGDISECSWLSGTQKKLDHMCKKESLIEQL